MSTRKMTHKELKDAELIVKLQSQLDEIKEVVTRKFSKSRRIEDILAILNKESKE